MMMNLTSVSRFIALILRHHPEVINIRLDEHGWADTAELVCKTQQKYPEFSFAVLQKIVREDNKQRYVFSEDKRFIRANQGHSINVDVELETAEPPRYLYHGTAVKYVSSIDKIGLIPKSRLYVHLSADKHTAENVGRRHGNHVAVYLVAARKMYDDGEIFYLSRNKVWLVKRVPPEYLKKIME